MGCLGLLSEHDFRIYPPLLKQLWRAKQGDQDGVGIG